MSAGLPEMFLLWSGLAVVTTRSLPPRWLPLAWLLCGAGFLAAVDTLSLASLVVAGLLCFALAQRFPGSRRALLLGISLILAGYGYFLQTGVPLASGIGAGVVLPLGMAFYSLRLIHYLLESYKGNLREHSLADFSGYLFFPGTLLVGPINRFDEFLRDLRRQRWDAELFSAGLQRVLYGLVKIVVLGNYLIGERLTPGMDGLLQLPAAGWYFAALLMWANLYVLFSGYSDLAIGFAALCGLRLRENFHFPFLARNIADFWRRWHISLAEWCRDYVYIPVLALSRAPLLAVVCSMIVLGLWHEWSIRYLLWGAYHGLGIAVFRSFAERYPGWAQANRGSAGLWRIAATLLTLHFVLFSFPVTKALADWLLALLEKGFV